jgi:hypothetical protein
MNGPTLETHDGMCHNEQRQLIPGDKEQTAYEMQFLSSPEVLAYLPGFDAHLYLLRRTIPQADQFGQGIGKPGNS